MLYHFKECVGNFPNRNAFCIRNVYYSYADFSGYVSKIRFAIEAGQRTFGGSIGVTSYDDIETYASFYAIMFAGLTFVPLDTSNPIDRNLMMIELAGIKTILTSRVDNHVSRMIQEFPEINFINTKDIAPTEINLNLPEITPENNAYILFTSGSTGVPKAVPISNRNVSAFIEAFYELGCNISETDRFLQSSDLLFDLSTMSYMIPISKGACVYTVPSEGIRYVNIYNILKEKEITFALMVPSVLSYLQPFFKDIQLEKMRYSLFCGEALYADILKKWKECVPNALIQNVYGPTEATNFCLAYDWDVTSSNKVYNGVVCIGKPMKNIEAIVVDENLNLLPSGEKGELCLAGPQLTSGYLNNPQKNKSSFFIKEENGLEKIFYKTGDVAFMDEDGDFMYCGRKDYQIKIHGYRIELGEIEFHSRQFISPANAAAVAYQNELGLTQIHLFVENYLDDKEKILEHLKNKIPQYMLPSKITSIPVFPLNSNGKIDRKALLNIVGELKE